MSHTACSRGRAGSSFRRLDGTLDEESRAGTLLGRTGDLPALPEDIKLLVAGKALAGQCPAGIRREFGGEAQVRNRTK